MRVLHVSGTDRAGGRFTGFEMLRRPPADCQVTMAVQSRTVESPLVYQLPSGNELIRGALNVTSGLLDRIGFDGAAGVSGAMLRDERYYRDADIVHYHLLHARSQVSVLSLPALTRAKPTVWTLHDMWALTGGCEHPIECLAWKDGCAVQCPHPRRTSLFSRSAPRVHWEIKRRAYQQSRLNFIVASSWMESRVRESPLAQGVSVELIPFGVDTTLFHPNRRILARSALGISANAFVVAFRNSGVTGDRYKGLKDVQRVLRALAGRLPLTVIVIGAREGFEFSASSFPSVFTGWIDDDALADSLAASDVFLMPSSQESFGLMAVEAMASGSVPIVYSGTALPETTDSPASGVCVEQGRHDLLAEAVARLYYTPAELACRRQSVLDVVSRRYRLERYLASHRVLYDRIIRERRDLKSP